MKEGEMTGEEIARQILNVFDCALGENLRYGIIHTLTNTLVSLREDLDLIWDAVAEELTKEELL